MLIITLVLLFRVDVMEVLVSPFVLVRRQAFEDYGGIRFERKSTPSCEETLLFIRALFVVPNCRGRCKRDSRSPITEWGREINTEIVGRHDSLAMKSRHFFILAKLAAPFVALIKRDLSGLASLPFRQVLTNEGSKQFRTSLFFGSRDVAGFARHLLIDGWITRRHVLGKVTTDSEGKAEESVVLRYIVR